MSRWDEIDWLYTGLIALLVLLAFAYGAAGIAEVIATTGEAK